MSNQNWAGKKDLTVLNYLQTRRSLSVRHMSDEAPSREEINTILETAARVPDHGKLFPWHFIVFDGDRRKDIGKILREAYKVEDPDVSEAKLDLEAERFLRAPLVIMVVSRMRRGKHPLWEQFLSAGALCQNVLLATNAMGYAGNWLTEWYSYNPVFRKALGLDERDNIAGVIYIGKPVQQPEGRPRPELSKITTYWSDGVAIKTGDDDYDQDKFDIPQSRIFGLGDE